MQTNAYSQGSFNNFNFSLKTSSGDEINFSAYDNKTLQYQSIKDASASVQSLTLTHEYGYKFSYSGDGLDAKDLAELDEALKNIRPKIDEFMKNVAQGDKIAGTSQSISSLANQIKSLLPQAQDENGRNFVNDGALKLFDSLLEQNKATKSVLEASKRLFDEILNKNNKVSFYV
jgi:putative ATP/GTP-binding protein